MDAQDPVFIFQQNETERKKKTDLTPGMAQGKRINHQREHDLRGGEIHVSDSARKNNWVINLYY